MGGDGCIMSPNFRQGNENQQDDCDSKIGKYGVMFIDSGPSPTVVIFENLIGIRHPIKKTEKVCIRQTSQMLSWIILHLSMWSRGDPFSI